MASKLAFIVLSLAGVAHGTRRIPASSELQADQHVNVVTETATNERISESALLDATQEVLPLHDGPGIYIANNAVSWKGLYVSAGVEQNTQKLGLLPPNRRFYVSQIKKTAAGDKLRGYLPETPFGPGWVTLADSSGDKLAIKAEGTHEYVADNSILNAGTWGLAYRKSKNIDDREQHDILKWGTAIRGVDEMDGWLRVGTQYLPMQINGVNVLTKQDYYDDYYFDDSMLQHPAFYDDYYYLYDSLAGQSSDTNLVGTASDKRSGPE